MKLEAKDLTAGYGKIPVIRNVSAEFAPGTINCIIGPNGSGKSTFLKSIAGLCSVFSGEILLDGHPLESYKQERYKHISYFSQTHIPSSVSVSRLILHGRFPHMGYPRKYREEDHEICRSVIAELGIEQLADKMTDQLSGGELQKVYFAMALVNQSEILLLDEPNSFLDIQYQLEMYRHLERLKKEGKTVIAVMHDIDQALRMSDQLLVFRQGQTAGAGTAEEIYRTGVIDDIFGICCRKVEMDGHVHYWIR